MAKPKRKVVVRWRWRRRAWECDHVGLDGRRRRPLFGTEAEALAHAAKVADELNALLPVESDAADPLKQMVVRDYVPRFLNERAADLASRTLLSYRFHLRGVVTERLGHLKVRDVRRRHVKALLAGLRAATYVRGKAKDAQARPYSPHTIRLVRAALSALLSEAVDEEVLDVNPCLGGPRRGRRAGKLTKAERAAHIRPLSLTEFARLVAAAGSAQPYGALFETMGKAGLRPGEAYALREDDLDVETRTLMVERALDHDGTVKSTKTAEMRTVRLTASLVRTLRHHLAWLKREAFQRGWGPPTWLFPTEANTALDPTKVAKVFKRALKAAKLSTHHRPYDLRHTYASLMLQRGAPITFVSQQLGHSNPSTTLRHYAHWIPGEGAQWADLLEPDSGTNARHAVGNGLEDLERSGAGGGSRTRDLLITNQLLCH